MNILLFEILAELKRFKNNFQQRENINIREDAKTILKNIEKNDSEPKKKSFRSQ